MKYITSDAILSLNTRTTWGKFEKMYIIMYIIMLIKNNLTGTSKSDLISIKR